MDSNRRDQTRRQSPSKVLPVFPERDTQEGDMAPVFIRTMRSLQRNNMQSQYFSTTAQMLFWLKEKIPTGALVGVGGSVTLEQTGILDLLKTGQYQYLDRYEPGLSDRELRQVFLKSFTCDYYLTSANAITEHGELYCVDGLGNRISAMLYGPRQVIIVAGKNKIVPDLAAAVSRVKRISIPANALRRGRVLPCTKRGECIQPECHERHLMCAAHAYCSDAICSNSVIFSTQTQQNRIIVVLVDEDLGL